MLPSTCRRGSVAAWCCAEGPGWFSLQGAFFPEKFHANETTQLLLPDQVQSLSSLYAWLRAVLRGGMGMPGCKILFGPTSPLRQAQSSSRWSQVYHFLVRRWGVSLSPFDRREDEEACPGLHSMSAAEQSQDFTCLSGSYQPMLCCSQASASAERWSRSHPVTAGLADSLWKGDMPAWLAATYTITTRVGRATLKWDDVWLGSACSGTHSSPCTVIILSNSIFFPIYVSFSSLVLAIFAFI